MVADISLTVEALAAAAVEVCSAWEASSLEVSVTRVPDGGVMLGRIKAGHTVYIKGAFPVYDVAKRKVGAIIILRDVTVMYGEMMKNIYITLAGCVSVAFLNSLFVHEEGYHSLRQPAYLEGVLVNKTIQDENLIGFSGSVESLFFTLFLLFLKPNLHYTPARVLFFSSTQNIPPYYGKNKLFGLFLIKICTPRRANFIL